MRTWELRTAIRLPRPCSEVFDYFGGTWPGEGEGEVVIR